MKRRMKIAALLTLALVFGLLAAYESTFAAKSDSAMLTGVKGSVAVKAEGSGEWKEARDKMKLTGGDTIKTSAGASCIIKFSDGSMVKVGPMSSTKVSDIGLTKTVDVDSGKTWSRVRKMDKDSDFKVKTPTAVAGVRGTFFSSEADEGGSQFDVFDGMVEVSSADNPSQSVAVTAHNRTTVAAGKAPASPTAIPSGEEESGRGGFSQEEYTSATFEIQISITPQVLQPGGKATVNVQVLKNGEPYNNAVELRLGLSGSAMFTSNSSGEITTSTDSKGAVSLEITNSVAEDINVDASMVVRVKK